MLHRALSIVALLLTLTSCASVKPSFAPTAPCEAEAFTVTDDFAGARRGHCEVLSSDHVRLTILPEDDGYINDSPWYAFKVVPNIASTATITMRYRGGHHRYPPKISRDGVHWSTLGESVFKISYRRGKATIKIATGDEPFWIAGQEVVTPLFYDDWSRKFTAAGLTDLSILGYSQSELPVSMLNPDGVIGGNWRHNLNATDLNRDWGPFNEPETQLAQELLGRLDASEKSIRVFLDFHSTNRNVFYAPNDDNPTIPPRFTRTWLENAKPRIMGYDFSYEENPIDEVGISKNYMYKRYGIPSTTYEVGDETDREAIRQAAIVFSEELMLEQDYQ